MEDILKFFYELEYNTKKGFKYSVYSDIFKETFIYTYKSNQKAMYEGGEKISDCEENNTHSEPVREVKTNIKTNNKPENSKIDISNLETGVYVIKQGSKTAKFIKK